MLQEELKKELISKYIVLLMASHAGIKAGIEEIDHGVDLTLKEVQKYIFKEKVRYMNSGKAIDVQLKCTTEKSIKIADGFAYYDLEVKNYNDLVLRQQEDEVLPMILILVILPKNPQLWMENSFEKLVLHAKRLWYRPEMGSPLSSNKRTIRVKIPLENVLTTHFFTQLFEHYSS